LTIPHKQGYSKLNNIIEAADVELSPEERRRIYEEEKAKIEAREQIERERRRTSQETSVGMEPNVAGLLCYLGVWATGIIFFVLEQKNNWVRFHAAQSIIVFGGLALAGAFLGWIPVIGTAFSVIIGIIGFILWIVLMVKAYHGERFKVTWAGDIAERMVTSAGTIGDYQKPPAPPPVTEISPESREAPSTTGVDMDEKIGRKVDEFFKRKREGRITGSAFAIAWSIVAIIFFNFFYEYVAYYNAETVDSTVIWTRSSFFTSEISLWLPILTTTLIIAILGHLILIIFDRYLLRRIILFVIDIFGLATVVTLLSVFPFDFGVIPNSTAAAATHVGVTIALICISVGLGISLLVRLIKFLVAIPRGISQYGDNA
jgi:uncharacterized membrane protein